MNLLIKEYIKNTWNLNPDKVLYHSFFANNSHREFLYMVPGPYFTHQETREELVSWSYNKDNFWLSNTHIIPINIENFLFYIPLANFTTIVLYKCYKCGKVISEEMRNDCYFAKKTCYSSVNFAHVAECIPEGIVIPDYKTKKAFTNKLYYLPRRVIFNTKDAEKAPRIIDRKRLHYHNGLTYIEFEDKKILLNQRVVNKILKENPYNKFLCNSYL